MPRVRISLITALVATVVVGTAACSASDTAGSPESNAPSSTVATSTVAVPAGSVRLGGAVQGPVTLSIAQLRGFPTRTEAVSFQSSKGSQSHTYTGAALSEVLESARPSVDTTAKNPDLTLAIRATGSDGYATVVSYGELSPDFGATPVLVAYTEDGRALSAPRLVVPGDIKGGRYVSDLVMLEVVDIRGR